MLGLCWPREQGWRGARAVGFLSMLTFLHQIFKCSWWAEAWTFFFFPKEGLSNCLMALFKRLSSFLNRLFSLCKIRELSPPTSGKALLSAVQAHPLALMMSCNKKPPAITLLRCRTSNDGFRKQGLHCRSTLSRNKGSAGCLHVMANCTSPAAGG